MPLGRATTYVVFLIPVLAGIAAGAAVLAQAAEEGYILAGNTPSDSHSGSISISGLERSYGASESVEIAILVSDESYDCGDLYITIYDEDGTSVSQNGYFGECFAASGSSLPVSEAYSERVGTGGRYSIEAKMYDSGRSGFIDAKETFYVR